MTVLSPQIPGSACAVTAELVPILARDPQSLRATERRAALAAVDHARSCPHCRALLTDELGLSWQCPRVAAAFAPLLAGTLDPADRSWVQTHLDHCWSCRADLALARGGPPAAEVSERSRDLAAELPAHPRELAAAFAPSRLRHALQSLAKPAPLTPNSLIAVLAEYRAVRRLETVRGRIEACGAAHVRPAVDPLGRRAERILWRRRQASDMVDAAVPRAQPMPRGGEATDHE